MFIGRFWLMSRFKLLRNGSIWFPMTRKCNTLRENNKWQKRVYHQQPRKSLHWMLIVLYIFMEKLSHQQCYIPFWEFTLFITKIFPIVKVKFSIYEGMNYIAGFIYLKTLNEESAYRVFEYLMEIRFK